MINLSDDCVGRRVVYRDKSGYYIEEGVITAFNNCGIVFVRYGSDMHSKGTRQNDLEWVTPNGLAFDVGLEEVEPTKREI